MEHTSLHCRSHSLFAEKRLCNQLPVGPIGPVFLPEDVRKQSQNNDTTKIDAERQQQVKELRGKLAKLEVEVKRFNTLKESTEKQQHLKQERELIDALLTSDPGLLQEAGGQNIANQLRAFLQTPQSQALRKELVVALAPLATSQSFTQYMSPDGILKTAQSIVGSAAANAFRDFVREKTGMNIDTTAIVDTLFDLLRATAANFFATFRFFNAMQDMRTRGRDFHFRISLEAEAKRTVSPPLSFTDMFAMTNQQLEDKIPAPKGETVRKSWVTLYEQTWLPSAQAARRNSMSAALLPVPTYEQARIFTNLSPEERKKHIASLNGTPITQPNTLAEGPRTIDGLTFPAPAFALEVRADQSRSVTVNGTQMDFTKDNNNVIQVRTTRRTNPIRFGTIGGTAITRLTLFSPTINAGDIQVRLNENATQPGFTLSTLVDQSRRNPNSSTINLTDPTTLAFA